MDYNEINLQAGVAYALPVTGHYLRVLSGQGLIKLKTDSGIETDWLAGLMGRFSKPENGEPFRKVWFTSDLSQTLKIVTSAFPISDSRLTGDVDINGLLQVITAGGASIRLGEVQILPEQNAEVLPNDTNRISAVLQADNAWHFGIDNTVDATNAEAGSGNTNSNNSAAIWAYNPSATDTLTIKTIEDIK